VSATVTVVNRARLRRICEEVIRRKARGEEEWAAEVHHVIREYRRETKPEVVLELLNLIDKAHA
jgi:hypothetical protein